MLIFHILTVQWYFTIIYETGAYACKFLIKRLFPVDLRIWRDSFPSNRNMYCVWRVVDDFSKSLYANLWHTVALLPRCMQTRTSLAMRKLSVRLSVCQTRELWQKRKICPDFILYDRSFSLVFSEEWLVGATPSTWNFGSTGPRWSEVANFSTDIRP